jgi:hypothetical protein
MLLIMISIQHRRHSGVLSPFLIVFAQVLLNHLILLSCGLRGHLRFSIRFGQKLRWWLWRNWVIWRSGRCCQVAELRNYLLFWLKWNLGFWRSHNTVRDMFKKVTKMSSQWMQFLLFLLFCQLDSFFNDRLSISLRSFKLLSLDRV